MRVARARRLRCDRPFAPCILSRGRKRGREKLRSRTTDQIVPRFRYVVMYSRMLCIRSQGSSGDTPFPPPTSPSETGSYSNCSISIFFIHALDTRARRFADQHRYGEWHAVDRRENEQRVPCRFSSVRYVAPLVANRSTHIPSLYRLTRERRTRESPQNVTFKMIPFGVFRNFSEAFAAIDISTRCNAHIYGVRLCESRLSSYDNKRPGRYSNCHFSSSRSYT